MKPLTTIIVSVTTIVILCLVTVLILTEHDIVPLLIALAAIPGALGTLFGLQKISNELSTVRRQTNGNLTDAMSKLERERMRNEELIAMLSETQTRKLRSRK